MDYRVAIERIDANGTMTRGTARFHQDDVRRRTVLDDFRDLQGQPLEVPPGASVIVPLEESPVWKTPS